MYAQSTGFEITSMVCFNIYKFLYFVEPYLSHMIVDGKKTAAHGWARASNILQLLASQ